MVKIHPEVAAVLIQIIDKAASKGMFVGNEITTVGNIRGHLTEELTNIKTEEKSTTPPKMQVSEK